MPVTYGQPQITFGLPTATGAYSYDGFPFGARIRLKLRKDDFAKCYVKLPDRFYCCYVNIDEQNVVRPTLFEGANFKSLVPPTPYPQPVKRLIGEI